MSGERDPLAARLFGYGVPYRVQMDEAGGALFLDVEPAGEAVRLARELAVLAGLGEEAGVEREGEWAWSLPFGRCGVRGLPREYLRVYHTREAYLDSLTKEGARSLPVSPGRAVVIEPGRVVRVRARALPGRQVLVAFQTEDRSPLVGHAAPFSLGKALPESYRERLEICHAAFRRMESLAETDPALYRAHLEDFFHSMEERVVGDPRVAARQEAAREAGSYDAGGDESLFERQRRMLTRALIEEIRDGGPEVFRFPGMFGAIAPLFQRFPGKA